MYARASTEPAPAQLEAFAPMSTPAIATSPSSEGMSAHFLTIATLFRRPLFLDPDAARAVSRAQAASAIWGRAGCLAWVLMPDRWQGLVLAPADEPLEPLLCRFKAITARAVDARFRVNGWLWAKGFNQRRLERHEDRLAVARHLVSNPVRAGLARSVGAYPYWDAIWLDPDRLSMSTA